MKIILPFLFIVLMSHRMYAQEADSVIARVRYTYINKTDTLKSGKPHTENMLLFIGKNGSIYTSYDKLNYEIASDAKFQAKIASMANNGKPVAIAMEEPPAWHTTTTYHYYVKEHKLFTREMIALQNYLIEEVGPNIEWKMSPDTMSFSGVFCQKATANFEGKNWIAWFAQGLAYQTGPWKLKDLPGLIIEAYSDNKQIHFQFAGIEKAKAGDHLRLNDITKRPGARPDTYNPIDQLIGMDVGAAYFENIIKLPRNVVKTTRKSYDKLMEAFKKDPKGFTKAQYGH